MSSLKIDERSHKVGFDYTSEEEMLQISEKELQQGIDVSPEIVSKIQTCMKNILQCKEEGGVKLYDSEENHRVFVLDTVPDLIFKMKGSKWHSLVRDDSMKACYQTMIKAQAVILTHQLGLLVLPKAKLFTVTVEREEYEIIAERKIDINPERSAQEQYFQDYAKSLNEAIRQYANFICKTGCSDVEPLNNPVVNNSLDENGNRKIAIIGIEETDGAKIGLFGGGWGRRGLVRCVTEEQGKMVEEIAKQNGINTSIESPLAASFEQAYAARKKEIEEEQKLKEYYADKNITDGTELIQLDENSVDFSEYPEKVEKLRENTKLLVQTINDGITKASPEKSIKGRRCVHIDINKYPFILQDSRLIRPGENEYATASAFETEEEFRNATYLGYIVRKLVELKVIHSFKRNSRGYLLQA
jgi:hypothetical protein